MTGADTIAGEARVDAVVVGSGFGGAVAAARLAQAGRSVVVLERGRRWAPDAFPRERDLRRDWLWGEGRGLFDVRWLDRMISVQGAGWGGGSLVYANVFARPPHEVFEHGWPDGYDRAALDPYYDLAAHMLETSPVAADPGTGDVPARTRLLERAVAASGLPAATVRPELAVRFGDPDRLVQNRHGALQAGCRFVGQCVIGCPHRAKNTLDYNYLFVAERAGAVARTDTEVTRIAPDHDGYLVEGIDHETGERKSIVAGAVFLAAGAVGTTELLLRMRDVTGDLPDLSARLGERFSGNGDYLSFVRRRGSTADPRSDLERGPTITTTSVFALPRRGRRIWFQLQDGNYPAVLAALAAATDPAPLLARVLAAPRRALPATVARSTAMTLLLMGRDSANGVMHLDHNGEAALRWNNRSNGDLYRAEGWAARAVGRRMGARALPLPTWTFLRKAITVHNLGGASIGTSIENGVVDVDGEVFGYPGLIVMDGAALPGATGANPSATITAVAERRIEHYLRAVTGDSGWTTPERADVRPRDVPEDRAAATLRASDGTSPSVLFDERLRGHLLVDGHRVAAVLELRASIEDWDEFALDPRHCVALAGTVTIGGRASERPARGRLLLFPVGSALAMRYDLTFDDDSGRPARLTGVKRQHGVNPFLLWPDLTRLRIRLHGDGSRGEGLVVMGPIAVARLVASIRSSASGRAGGAARVGFIGFFLRNALVRPVRVGGRSAEGRPSVGPRDPRPGMPS